jgi:hypothetical protein
MTLRTLLRLSDDPLRLSFEPLRLSPLELRWIDELLRFDPPRFLSYLTRPYLCSYLHFDLPIDDQRILAEDLTALVGLREEHLVRFTQSLADLIRATDYDGLNGWSKRAGRYVFLEPDGSYSDQPHELFHLLLIICTILLRLLTLTPPSNLPVRMRIESLAQ